MNKQMNTFFAYSRKLDREFAEMTKGMSPDIVQKLHDESRSPDKENLRPWVNPFAQDKTGIVISYTATPVFECNGVLVVLPYLDSMFFLTISTEAVKHGVVEIIEFTKIRLQWDGGMVVEIQTDSLLDACRVVKKLASYQV